jgi:hypothetical protein
MAGSDVFGSVMEEQREPDQEQKMESGMTGLPPPTHATCHVITSVHAQSLNLVIVSSSS